MRNNHRGPTLGFIQVSLSLCLSKNRKTICFTCFDYPYPFSGNKNLRLRQFSVYHSFTINNLTLLDRIMCFIEEGRNYFSS